MNLQAIVEANSLKIHTLESTISSCQSEINLYRQRCEQYAQAYDSLLAQVQELKRYRFGKKSERFIDPEDPQVNLFDHLPKRFEEAETAGNELADDTTAKRRALPKPASKKKEIPVRVEIIPVPEVEKQCACGNCKTVIRYETKRLMHHQKAVVEVIEQRREVVACTHGCESQIITASAPHQVLPKIKATEEFLSWLVVSKLEDRQPLYHLEKQLSERFGMDCS